MKIILECASWFKREDGLVQIINAKGKNIILNQRYSKVWEVINGEIVKDDLVEILKSKMTLTEIEDILQDMKCAELISIYDETEEFDRLFD